MNIQNKNYFDWFGCPIIEADIINIIKNINISTNRSNQKEIDYIQELKELLYIKFHCGDDHHISIGFNASDISNRLCLSLLPYNFNVQASLYEHHSSYAPWLKNNNFSFAKIDQKTKLPIFLEKKDIFLITLISNITGQCFIDSIIQLKQKFPESLIIVDACQIKNIIDNINFKNLPYDCLYFSSHKLGALHGLGIAILSSRLNKLISQPLFIGGGNIIEYTINKQIIKNDDKLLIGTPNPFAIETLKQVLRKDILIKPLNDQLILQLKDLDIKLQNIGWKKISSDNNVYLLTYIFDKPFNIHDLSEELMNANITVRLGSMCCTAFTEYLNTDCLIRLSFGYSNTVDEIKFFWEIINKMYNEYKY